MRPRARISAEKLAADLGVNINELATKMFEAKSDVSAFSDAELLRMDSKEYNVAGKELRVSVLETTSPKTVLDRKALEERTCECYGVIKTEYDRLLPMRLAV